MNDNTKRIYIVPMRGCPVFPGLFTTIEVVDPKDIEAIQKAESREGFGLLLLKNENKDPKELCADDFFKFGTFVKVRHRVNTIYDSVSIFIETLCRFKVKEMFFENGLISASIEIISESKLSVKENTLLLNILKKSISNRTDKSLIMDNIRFNTTNIQDSIKLAYYLISVIIPHQKQQEYLECLDLDRAIAMLLKEIEDQNKIQKLQEQIQYEVNDNISKKQKEIVLREELRIIQKKLSQINSEGPTELTSTDLKNAIKNPPKKKLIERLEDLNLEGEARETVFEEYSRLETMDTMNPEYNTLRTYLETVADLPWNTFSEENYDIDKAKEILENDHYGIKDVKNRILEFLAVRKLKNDTKGSIICLIGPPGTGKTSVGRSIARALNKEYYRFSVGGMRDEAEIKGHRRTYIGAMPGQIIKGLKVTKTKNPVFVIDEIDKMTVSNQGDPAAALLEVLDPEQNTTFRDHYLEVPFDISNILFIVTANSTENIPRPLLDRMECIELSGYTSEEKLHIGKKYLVPKSRVKHGLKAKDIKFSDKILRKIAEEYAREAGVRNFEKALDRINRKVAMEIVTNQVQTPVVISEENLVHYLDQPIFVEDELIKANKPGMSIGLAWTSMGGDVLAIEAQRIPGKGELKLTGQLGDVMKESASIALSYIKSIAEAHDINELWFSKNSIHLHVPEGATPKDGPSAGITMATAIYSLITNQIMAPDMAMTGELSLLGKVMPIGGLKEKVLAAKRNKVKTIIIPKHNKRDLDKLETEVKKGLTFHLVGDMEEVLKLAFPNEKHE